MYVFDYMDKKKKITNPNSQIFGNEYKFLKIE